MSQTQKLPANKRYNQRGGNIFGILFGGIFLLTGLSSLTSVLGSSGSIVSQLMMALIFGGAFGGIGLFVLKKSLKRPNLTKEVEQITQQGISSEEKGSHIPLYIIGVVFSVPALGVAALGIAAGEAFGFVAIPFGLVGGALLYFARKSQKTYHKIGPSVLHPDPLPAVLGRELGGSFELNALVRDKMMMRLTCKHTYSTGSGDNRTTHTRTLHQFETQAYISSSGSGKQKVSFLFELPANAAETGSDSHSGSVSWTLSAEGLVTPAAARDEVLPFSRNWEVPVLSEQFVRAAGLTVANSHIHIPQQFQQEVREELQLAAERDIEEQIDMETDLHGRSRIVSDSGRNSSMWGFLLLFGAIFGGIGIFMGFMALSEGGMLWLMAAIFTLVGGLTLVLGIFMAGRRLEVTLHDGQLQVIRSVFGRQLYQHNGTLHSPEQLSLETTMTSTTNGVVTEYLAIFAQLDDKRVKLVEGIAGREAGKAMLARLTDSLTTGLNDELL